MRRKFAQNLAVKLLWAVGLAAVQAVTAAPASAAPPLVLEGKDCYLLATSVEILRSPAQGLTLEQVRNPPWSTRFQAAQETPTLRLGINQRPVWLRFRIKEISGKPPYFLELDSSQIQNIDAYLAQAGSSGDPEPSFREYFTGSARPVNSRPIDFRTFVLPLPPDMPPQQYSYVRLANSGALVVRPYVWSQDGLEGRLSSDSYFFGIIFGVLVAMLLTNLFFYTTLRDPAYLYYVVYVLSMIFFEMSLYGQWDVWFKLAPAVNQRAPWVAAGLVSALAALFTRSFLRTRLLTPKADKVLKVFAGLGVLEIGLALVGGLAMASITAHVLGLLGPVLAICVGLVALRKGQSSARYFLLAWSVMAVALFTLALKGLGLLPQAISSTTTLPLATALESVLLSLALADRVRSLRRQREEAQVSERRFRQLSLTDELTHLYNKRFLDSRLQSEVDHAVRSAQPLSVLALDVDYLKEFNDNFGHAAGDLVLLTVAQVMRQRLRNSDYAVRTGGDEFVVIMPETNLEQARWAAERIRAGVYEHDFQLNQVTQMRATVSVGAAQHQGEQSPARLLERADQAMYQAKQEGKNRVREAGSA
ncbi:MAG: sensor domain-containing diguanylate cyclase [Deltaproteobacteria bacterium]|nr:sensor domain-containing diguanylate cyclase [Deltaproteobacteria bacterium]